MDENPLEPIPEAPDDFNLDGPLAGGGGGSSETQSGFLYCSSGTVGIVKIDVAAETYEITGVPMNGTAFGNGHDSWWYVNGGAGQTESRELYRMQPELVSGPVGPRVVIELIGSGTRSIEDLAATPDGLTLYGVGDGFLFTLDRQTGVQTDVGPLGVNATGFPSTNFAPSSNGITWCGLRILLHRVGPSPII